VGWISAIVILFLGGFGFVNFETREGEAGGNGRRSVGRGIHRLVVEERHGLRGHFFIFAAAGVWIERGGDEGRLFDGALEEGGGGMKIAQIEQAAANDAGRLGIGAGDRGFRWLRVCGGLREGGRGRGEKKPHA